MPIRKGPRLPQTGQINAEKERMRPLLLRARHPQEVGTSEGECVRVRRAARQQQYRPPLEGSNDYGIAKRTVPRAPAPSRFAVRFQPSSVSGPTETPDRREMLLARMIATALAADHPEWFSPQDSGGSRG
jgi:hypothetical protein